MASKGSLKKVTVSAITLSQEFAAELRGTLKKYAWLTDFRPNHRIFNFFNNGLIMRKESHLLSRTGY